MLQNSEWRLKALQKIKSCSKHCFACNIDGLTHNFDCNSAAESWNIVYLSYIKLFKPTRITLSSSPRYKTPIILMIQGQTQKQKFYLP